MPFLHAHKRRVPTQDVDRSIVVGMGAQAAKNHSEAIGIDPMEFKKSQEKRSPTSLAYLPALKNGVSREDI